MSDVHYSLFNKGLRVWLRNPNAESEASDDVNSCPPIWITGTIIEQREEGHALVRTDSQPSLQLDVLVAELYPRNVQENVDDMVSYSNLHEAAILNNIIVRYKAPDMQLIYTMAGPILISVNPYKLVKDKDGAGIYDETYINMYRSRASQASLDIMNVQDRAAATLRPHVFAVAEDTLVQFRKEGKSQSVIISGESGSGKTECTKQIMQYVTACAEEGAMSSGDSSEAMGPKLLRTNPVLEALGNAKTVRNDNSSRFGKWMQIFLEVSVSVDGDSRATPEGDKKTPYTICGASIEEFLLEKSRLVSQGQGETNYHVFYQLLHGSSQAQVIALKLKPTTWYRYLNPSLQPNTNTSGGTSPRRGIKNIATHTTLEPITANKEEMITKYKDDYNDLVGAMDVIGLVGNEREEMFRVLSAVLMMGNINFQDDTGGSEGGASVHADSTTVLSDVCELAGLDKAGFMKQLVVLERTAAGGSIVSPLDAEHAADGLNALAKGIYGRLFKWVVETINKSLGGEELKASGHKANCVGILDIFGFEVLETNSLEQLLIALVNERIQQLFTSFVFRLEQEVYEKEQINYSEIEFTDNQNVIDFLEKRPVGVFCLLDEACLFPRSTDASFLQKCMYSHKNNELFAVGGVKHEASFVVKHSAANVRYTVAGFLGKNKDRLNDNLMRVAENSSLGLLSYIFGNANGVGNTNSDNSAQGELKAMSPSRGNFTGANAFLASKFREDIGRLVSTLKTTTPHFVRCLKPNSLKRPMYIDPSMVLHQLQYLGVLDSIRVRHSGFSYRTVYSDFYERFIMLAATQAKSAKLGLEVNVNPNANLKELCKLMVDILWEMAGFPTETRKTMIQFGVTKIFMRKQAIQSLEAMREVLLHSMHESASTIQRMARKRLSKFRLKLLKFGVIRAQAAWRSVSTRQRWIAQRYAQQRMQRTMRMFVAKVRVSIRRRALRTVQRFFRNNNQRAKWLRARRGLKLLHTLVRGYTVRQHVVRMINAVETLQRTSRNFLSKNREYWLKVRAALLLQALWRGHCLRQARDDVVSHLDVRRHERFRVRCIRRLQASWHAKLVRRQYLRIQETVTRISHWARSMAMRSWFRRCRIAVRTLQRVARGLIARQNVREMRTKLMLQDERWRLATVQEREMIQLASIHHSRPTIFDFVLSSENMMGSKGSKRKNLISSPSSSASAIATKARARRQSGGTSNKSTTTTTLVRGHTDTKRISRGGGGVIASKLLDVDVRIGAFEVYPVGWARSVGELEDELGRQGEVIESICVGSSHTMCLTDHGNIYSWGWSERGQLGHGTWDAHQQPRRVCLEEQLSQQETAAVLSSVKSVSGARSIYASTSERHTTSGVPRDLGGGLVVKQIATGEDHTIALSHTGGVFTWGANRYGQLGQGDKDNHATPIQVQSLRKVSEVACGAHHCVALVMAGSVYSWGSGAQLGHGVYAGNGDCAVPVVVRRLSKERVRHIKCGASFSAAVTHTGNLFTWGVGENGQLGLGVNMLRVLVPRVVEALSAESGDNTRRARGGAMQRRVAQVACGPRHCAAVGATGLVYTWGNNVTGELGHGDRCDRFVPTLVKRLAMRRVKQVVCSLRSTVALTDMHRVFAWGKIGCARAVSEEGADAGVAYGTKSSVIQTVDRLKVGHKQVPSSPKTPQILEECPEGNGSECLSQDGERAEERKEGDEDLNEHEEVEDENMVTCLWPSVVPIRPSPSRVAVKLFAWSSLTLGQVGVIYHQKALKETLLDEPLLATTNTATGADSCSAVGITCDAGLQSLVSSVMNDRGFGINGPAAVEGATNPVSPRGMLSGTVQGGGGGGAGGLGASATSHVWESELAKIEMDEVDGLDGKQLRNLVRELVNGAKREIMKTKAQVNTHMNKNSSTIDGVSFYPENFAQPLMQQTLANFMDGDVSRSPIERAKEHSWEDGGSPSKKRNSLRQRHVTTKANARDAMLRRLNMASQERTDALLTVSRLEVESENPNSDNLRMSGVVNEAGAVSEQMANKGRVRGKNRSTIIDLFNTDKLLRKRTEVAEDTGQLNQQPRDVVDMYRKQQQREQLSLMANSDHKSVRSNKVQVKDTTGGTFDSVQLSNQVRAEARRRIAEQVWSAGGGMNNDTNKESGIEFGDVEESKSEAVSTLGLGDNVEYASHRSKSDVVNKRGAGDVDQRLESMDAMLVRIRAKAAQDVQRVLAEQTLVRAGR